MRSTPSPTPCQPSTRTQPSSEPCNYDRTNPCSKPCDYDTNESEQSREVYNKVSYFFLW